MKFCNFAISLLADRMNAIPQGVWLCTSIKPLITISSRRQVSALWQNSRGSTCLYVCVLSEIIGWLHTVPLSYSKFRKAQPSLLKTQAH